MKNSHLAVAVCALGLGAAGGVAATGVGRTVDASTATVDRVCIFPSGKIEAVGHAYWTTGGQAVQSVTPELPLPEPSQACAQELLATGLETWKAYESL